MSSRRGASNLAVLFIATSALLAFAVVLLVRWRASNPVHAPPPVADPDQPIHGFRAEAHVGGVLLVASLAPLYADAGRQRFESEALRARLSLESGEPWRLSLRLDGEGGDARATQLGTLRVVDERGEALRALDVEPAPGDPVRTLFAPPRGLLAPGASAQCVLWGRAPGARAQLSGVGTGEIALEAHTLRRIDLNQPLARIERDTGKKPASPASDSDHADRD